MVLHSGNRLLRTTVYVNSISAFDRVDGFPPEIGTSPFSCETQPANVSRWSYSRGPAASVSKRAMFGCEAQEDPPIAQRSAAPASGERVPALAR